MTRRNAVRGVVAASVAASAVIGAVAVAGQDAELKNLPGSPADGKAIALALAERYGDLVAVATRRRVNDSEIVAAGIAPTAPSVRGLLDYYTCGKDEYGYPAGLARGSAGLLGYRGMGPDQLLASAFLGAYHGPEEGSEIDRHILRIERRDGRWQIVEDTVDNGGIHGPRDETSLVPEYVRPSWQAVGSHEKPPRRAVTATPQPVPPDVSAQDDIDSVDPGRCGWPP